MYTIYCCTDVENGYKYIGLTETSVQTRLQRHYDEALQGKSNSPFKKAIRDGRKFKVSVLKDNIDTPEQAAFWERTFIDKYKTYVGCSDCKGYNGTRGGEVVPSHLRKSNCILQYDIDGSFIGYFDSISQAAESVGVSRPALTQVLNGNGITCGGYQWRYANDDRPVLQVRDGMDNNRRAIIQYDLDGNYVDTFFSAEDAARSVNTYSSSIIKVCKGKHHSHKGYIWRYEDDTSEIKGLDEVAKSSADRKRSILQYDLNGNFLNYYESAKDAEAITGISLSAIRRACEDFNFTSGGYRWKFADSNFGNNKDKKINHKRGVSQYDLQGNLINTFESMIDASRKTGVERTSIYRCCNGKSKTGSGYIWKYNI